MKDSFFSIVGRTTDEKAVVRGVWSVFETYGLPLDVIFTVCISKGYMPDWIDLYDQMKQSGMKHSRIVSKLEEALSDAYGKDFASVVVEKINAAKG